MKLRESLRQNNSVNSELTTSEVNKSEINTHSIVKNSKEKNKIEKNSISDHTKGNDSIPEHIKEMEPGEKLLKKDELSKQLKLVFKSIPDIIKKIDVDDFDYLQRKEPELFNQHYFTIMEYKSIKL